jgi:hypothetical protein
MKVDLHPDDWDVIRDVLKMRATSLREDGATDAASMAEELARRVDSRVCRHEVDKNNVIINGYVVEEIVDVVCRHCAKTGTARLALTDLEWEDD